MTLETLYSAFIGDYKYISNPNFELSFSILLILHIIISNIFLLNFLVAILSTVYENMMEGGEFAYKRNKYLFIEKYSVALLDKWGY